MSPFLVETERSILRESAVDFLGTDFWLRLFLVGRADFEDFAERSLSLAEFLRPFTRCASLPPGLKLLLKLRRWTSSKMTASPVTAGASAFRSGCFWLSSKRRLISGSRSACIFIKRARRSCSFWFIMFPWLFYRSADTKSGGFLMSVQVIIY